MFNMDRRHVAEVTVEGRVGGQQILNLFHYKSQAIPPGTEGASDTWLLSFRAMFRAQYLLALYDVYSVHGYWLRMIVDSAPADVGGKEIYLPDYQFLPGNPVLDVGGLASLGVNLLPQHEALRVRKFPLNLKRGYYKACYNRFTQFGEPDQGTAVERWNDAFLANWNGILLNVVNEEIFGFDPPAGNGWIMSCYSTLYYARIIKPGMVGFTRDGAQPVDVMIAEPYVGTQITRRFRPAGGFGGK